MHTVKRLALLILAALSAAPTFAAGGGAQLAERFVVLMRYDEQFSKYQEQCVATQSSVSPEALVERNPSYFGGIRPGHTKWPAVVQAYGRYFQLACARPTKDEFLKSLSASYAATLTSAQLREAITFYSSRTGGALIAAHRRAASDAYESWSAINSRYLTDLTAKFQSEIASLVSTEGSRR